MRPWDLQGGPDGDTLLRLVKQERLSDQQIADQYGVRRQTVAWWRKRENIDKGIPPRLNHKKFIPWNVRARDANDGVARRLREWSTREQGHQLTQKESRALNEFMRFLGEEDLVVDYDRDRSGTIDPRTGEPRSGFFLRKRDYLIDKPSDIIRRPQPDA